MLRAFLANLARWKLSNRWLDERGRTAIIDAVLAFLLAVTLCGVYWIDRRPPQVVAEPEAEPEVEPVPPTDNPYYHSTAAVIIGIDQYSGDADSLPPLKFAVNDARELRELLSTEFGYDDGRIHYLADGKATRAAITKAFDSWLRELQLRADDAVLIFFAGHGLIDEQSSDGYLAAVDSRPGDLGTCVAVQWIRDQLSALPCRHKLLILDSCYSGTLFQPTRVESSPLAAR